MQVKDASARLALSRSHRVGNEPPVRLLRGHGEPSPPGRLHPAARPVTTSRVIRQALRWRASCGTGSRRAPTHWWRSPCRSACPAGCGEGRGCKAEPPCRWHEGIAAMARTWSSRLRSGESNPQLILEGPWRLRPPATSSREAYRLVKRLTSWPFISATVLQAVGTRQDGAGTGAMPSRR